MKSKAENEDGIELGKGRIWTSFIALHADTREAWLRRIARL